MERYQRYKDQRDKFRSQYVVVINRITGQEVTDQLFKQLEQLKMIKDQYKRKFINDRIYSLVTYWKSSAQMDMVYHRVIFLGKQIDEYELTSFETATLDECGITGLTMQHGEYFDLDFLADLLYNRDYQDVIQMDNNTMTHYQMTPTKRRQIEKITEKSFDLEEYLKRVENPTIVYGVSSVIKRTKSSRDRLISKRLTTDQLWEQIRSLRMEQKLVELEEMFRMFDNPATQHRVVSGKKLKKGIKSSLIKKLFAIPQKVSKYREKYEPDLLNFQLVEVVLLEKDSPVKRLIDDFKGAAGITYY